MEDIGFSNGAEKGGHVDMSLKMPLRKERTKEMGWREDLLSAGRRVVGCGEGNSGGKPDKGGM